jgi:neutral ceramidase
MSAARLAPGLVPLLLAAGLAAWLALAPKPRRVGVARIEVTPSRPVRLGGYGGRTGPHTGVAQRLWAKVLAIDGAGSAPALWLTLDSGGLSREVWLEARDRIHRRTGLPPERIVLTISHTHSAPATTGWAPFIQPEDMSEAENAAIDDYTREVVAKLEIIAGEALATMSPAELSWTEGVAGFAANRRTPGGPTDPALPVLVARGRDGAVRALVASYACHCTTCGGGLMQVCGDWAGFAQEAIERDQPGVQAMIAIGCAGDADPHPRVGDDQGLAFARQHGETVAAEVRRLLAGPRRPLPGALGARTVPAPLTFAPPFSREQLIERARDPGIVGRHARHWLALRDRGTPPPDRLDYEVTAWHFGEELAVVFLPGEVVVDYSLRLKRELDASRLWINAYSQWVPCYIPSRRILEEGGYEAETSLWYYNRPGRLAPSTEDTVVRAVLEAVPPGFRGPARPAPAAP